jgi:hypothetical protein
MAYPLAITNDLDRKSFTRAWLLNFGDEAIEVVCLLHAWGVGARSHVFTRRDIHGYNMTSKFFWVYYNRCLQLWLQKTQPNSFLINQSCAQFTDIARMVLNIFDARADTFTAHSLRSEYVCLYNLWFSLVAIKTRTFFFRLTHYSSGHYRYWPPDQCNSHIYCN